MKVAIENCEMHDFAGLDKMEADELKRRINIHINCTYFSFIFCLTNLLLISQKLQNKMIKKNELERKYIELQKAHTEQSIHMQNLQEDNGKLRKYKKTASKQEEVIEKLENLMKDTLRESRKGIF